MGLYFKDARCDIGTSILNATIAPSKEFMQGEFAQALQENAMCALAIISGGLSSVISSLGESFQSCTSDSQTADTIGALVSTFMIYDGSVECSKVANPIFIEQVLIKQFKAQSSFLVQECTIEALGRLYGNSYLSSKLQNAEAKRLLVGLITMAADEVQEELIRSLQNSLQQCK